MRKALIVAGGIVLSSIAVLAAAHIPTRYSGSFPSDGERTRITGTFTGKTLSLKFVARNQTGRTGNYSCTATSPTQTRCVGTYRSEDGKLSGPQVVVVTWGDGRPVATSFSH